MNTEIHPEQFPDLFREACWPVGPTQARFLLLDELPASNQIANINIVPYCAGKWVIIQLQEGDWGIPGGTLEPGEDYLAAAQRELLEEAGARLLSLHIFGGWRCTNLSPQPYRPHLPHPKFYRLVGIGQVEIIQVPSNPLGGEQVVNVDLVSLDTAIQRFRTCNRNDLADLYQIANQVASKYI